MRYMDGAYCLDSVDKDILRALTDNARMTLTEISDKTSRSRVAVHRRIKDMEEAGVIDSYTVIVNWDKVGNNS
jgi:DNA-binding Lrp family transcriptional regulator